MKVALRLTCLRQVFLLKATQAFRIGRNRLRQDFDRQRPDPAGYRARGKPRLFRPLRAVSEFHTAQGSCRQPEA
jgi:hypothetical protein